MKTLLICPSLRPGISQLGESAPLAAIPLLGKNLAAYWIEHLASRGARRVLVIAADRPDRVRAAVGDGSRWGIQVQVIPENRELTAEQARAKYRSADDPEWLESPDDAVLMDHLPGLPQHPLFETYSGWFAALQALLPRALTPDRIGCREVQPGIWLGMHARIPASAQLLAPCWIGSQVVVGAGAVIGPGAIIEDGVMVGSGARILRSVVAPKTLVGELTLIEDSLAQGSMLLHLKRGSCLRVPDPFLLCALQESPNRRKRTSWTGRILAAVAIAASAPLAFVAVLGYRGGRRSWLGRRRALRPLAGIRSPMDDTFTYAEFMCGPEWLRRWPQLLSIARGDMAWIGNRPTDPADAAGFANDFERLGLTAPVGLISLGDAEGSAERPEELAAHASFYAARRGPRLDAAILARTLLRPVPVRARGWRPAPEPSDSIGTQILKPQPDFTPASKMNAL